jgi:hypothetical protein
MPPRRRPPRLMGRSRARPAERRVVPLRFIARERFGRRLGFLALPSPSSTPSTRAPPGRRDVGSDANVREGPGGVGARGGDLAPPIRRPRGGRRGSLGRLRRAPVARYAFPPAPPAIGDRPPSSPPPLALVQDPSAPRGPSAHPASPRPSPPRRVAQPPTRRRSPPTSPPRRRLPADPPRRAALAAGSPRRSFARRTRASRRPTRYRTATPSAGTRP